MALIKEVVDLAVLKRRPVGKGAWRMEIEELMELESEGLEMLRWISNQHPNDAETQRQCANGSRLAAVRMRKLSLLLYYKDANHEQSEPSSAAQNGAGE